MAAVKLIDMQITDAKNYGQEAESLLSAEKLPVSDLPPGLDNFLVAVGNNEVWGVAGLEIYGNYGLLRSLAVKPAFRDQGIAGKLVGEIEKLAQAKGLNAIYLLTETAPEYFSKKGYIKITRTSVPAEVMHSSEFSYVCPQSAIVMQKSL
ncbi:MAG TPA: arsenic resistance N-acetyltransferase ArsN2 [Mucilaginibacter sp.]|nr:arsenic resistance N-acetyltransferase ArsN2 [Mucilaginibacter sp.]